MTPDKVFHALYRHNVEQIGIALRRGFAPTTTNEEGQSLLHEAALVGAAPIVAALVAAGAPVNAPNPDGDTPLILAITSASLASQGKAQKTREVLDLDQMPAPELIAWSAAAGDAVATVKALLACKANPNARGASGWTPLMAAINEGHPEMVQILLEAGADPTIHSEERITPMALAQRGRFKHPEIVELVRQALPAQTTMAFENESAVETPATRRPRVG